MHLLRRTFHANLLSLCIRSGTFIAPQVLSSFPGGLQINPGRHPDADQTGIAPTLAGAFTASLLASDQTTSESVGPNLTSRLCIPPPIRQAGYLIVHRDISTQVQTNLGTQVAPNSAG